MKCIINWYKNWRHKRYLKKLKKTHVVTTKEEWNKLFNKKDEHITPMPPIQYEPKRNNRFIAEIKNDELIIQPWVVRSVSDIAYVDDKWQSMEMSLYDPISPSTSQIVFSKLMEKKSKFNLDLNILDPTKEVISKWEIKNCDINSISFSGYDHDKDSFATITIIFTPEDCILHY